MDRLGRPLHRSYSSPSYQNGRQQRLREMTPTPLPQGLQSIMSSVSSSSSLSSSSSMNSFWMARDRKSKNPWRRALGYRVGLSRSQFAVLLCLVFMIVVIAVPRPLAWKRNRIRAWASRHRPHVSVSVPSLHRHKEVNPVTWLEKNSHNKYATQPGVLTQGLLAPKRPKAALISLVRNSELDGILQSMRQLEFHWNRKYNYPWIFFNEEPFSDEFKAETQKLTSAPCFYEVLPTEHWSLPDWIDEGRFMNSLEYLGAIGVGKGWMISYRHMCRWNSGFFYRHPKLKDYDWYWRVEPDVHFFCDIDYDVFRFMEENDMKYGFNMNILDDARSFPSLWSRTRAFINAHPDLIHPDADLDWLLDPHNSGDYNNCQFFSNFEVGSLNYFRGEANEAYFNWLDRGGGFYYERFGDAPIHTLSVAMFVPKKKIWYFRDIGYQHDIARHCPANMADKCTCEPSNLDENFYKLVPLESPQKKPADTCIRQFLGGALLDKKPGWNAEAERGLGGDGYHGYVSSGTEVEDGQLLR